jgi:hypothetical protein
MIVLPRPSRPGSGISGTRRVGTRTRSC